MLVSKSHRGALLLLSIKALMLHQHLLLSQAAAQALDGDDQFQAYHQDIGRISGSGGASASGATVIRQLQPPVSAGPASTPQRSATAAAAASHGRQATQLAPLRGSSSSQHAAHTSRTPSHQHQQQTPRLRFSATPGAPETTTGDFAASVQPTFTQLSPPPQRALFFQAHTAAPEPSAAAGPLPGGVRPALPVGAGNSQRQQVASGSLRSSVSARHSALMAQVAAERHQAALASQNEPEPPEAASFSAPQLVSSPSPSSATGSQLLDQAEEPLAAPSFEQVVSGGCPRKGVFSYPNKDHCDRYYICTNGTFTEEACPNGLSYGTMGAVYQHCAYSWNIDCGHKKTPEAISSPGCPWQFGIFPVSGSSKCSLDYFVCEWGVPERKRCQPEGLFYDDRIKGCQWADQLGCKSEQVLNFKCPAEDEDNPYWPYPRYYHTKQDVVVCVNEQPRLVHCNEDQVVDPGSLACMDLHKNKKSKKKQPSAFRSS